MKKPFAILIPVPEDFLDDIFASYPEYGCYSLRCTSFDYANFTFKFTDAEDGKKYTLTRAKAVKGFKQFAALVAGGKLFFEGLELLEPGSYDAYAMDAVLQCCLLGEVIYG